MIRALLMRVFRHQRWLLLFLALWLFGFEWILIEVAESFETGPGIRETVETLPEWLKKWILSEAGKVSFPAIVAFGFQDPGALLPAIALVVFLATLPAGDGDEGLLDLFLARPLSRRNYLLAVLLAVVLASLLLPLCQLCGILVGQASVEMPTELPWWRFLPCVFGFTLLLLGWGGLALVSNTFVKRRGTAVAFVFAPALGFYVVEVLAEFSEFIDRLRWISPFHYFKPIPAAVESRTPIQDPLVLLGLFAASTGLAFWRFGKRDL